MRRPYSRSADQQDSQGIVVGAASLANTPWQQSAMVRQVEETSALRITVPAGAAARVTGMLPWAPVRERPPSGGESLVILPCAGAVSPQA
jgi:hypothetical protein